MRRLRGLIRSKAAVLLLVPLAGVVLAGCPGPGPQPPIPPVPNPSPVLLGGVDLNAYCRSIGFDFAELTSPQIGANAAYNNWVCSANGGSIVKTLPQSSFDAACTMQYNQNSYAHPANPNDAFTWQCFHN
jgi:hypothetical protein